MPIYKKTVIVAYIPVLHDGYRKLFQKHREASALYLLGEEITKTFVPLSKDIRALPPTLIRDAIDSWNIFDGVYIIRNKADWKSLLDTDTSIVMPDEDVMHDLKKRCLPKANVIFDSIFLRWDKHKSFDGQPVNADQVISVDDFDRKMMNMLSKEAEKSPDFWRHIGAAVLKNRKIIFMRHNHAVPSPLLPYVEGDPRSDFHKGINVELSTVLHAEAGLIADAAREGLSLKNAEMYVTTFPCPPCAKLIAYSGIKRIYYSDGYGVLDGERILRSQGVEIVFVKK